MLRQTLGAQQDKSRYILSVSARHVTTLVSLSVDLSRLQIISSLFLYNRIVFLCN